MLFAMARVATVVLGVAQIRDTSLTTVRGVIAVSGDSAAGSLRAVVVLAEPFVVAGKQIWVLTLSGDTNHWRDWDSRYVEATGTLDAATPGQPFTVTRVHDVEPAGAATREVVSLSHHSNVSLAVVPRSFSATSSGDPSTGITPLIFYKINVSGQTNIEIQLPTQDLICVSVGSPGAREPTWRDSWRVSQKGAPFAIRVGPVLRVFIPVPANLVSRPGDYEVQAGVCGNPEYHVTTLLHVTAP